MGRRKIRINTIISESLKMGSVVEEIEKNLKCYDHVISLNNERKIKQIRDLKLDLREEEEGMPKKEKEQYTLCRRDCNIQRNRIKNTKEIGTEQRPVQEMSKFHEVKRQQGKLKEVEMGRASSQNGRK